MKPRRLLFRESALKEYWRKRDKDVLPRFMAPSIFILLYLLLFLLLLAGLLAWWREVPVFTAGSGVVLREKTSNASSNDKKVIVLFLPAKYASQIPMGASVQMYAEPAGQQVTGTIERVEANIISPDEARKRYRLNTVVARVIPPSATVVRIIPATANMPHLSEGDFVSAQVPVGSQRIFSLLFASSK